MSRLKVQPGGHIVDGEVDYNVQGDDLALSVNVEYKIFIFTKSFSFQQTYHGTPGQWDRKMWQQVGYEADIDGATFRVIDCNGAQSHVQVTDPEYTLSGNLLVDVSGDPTQPIQVLGLDGMVTVFGITQHVVAEAG